MTDAQRNFLIVIAVVLVAVFVDPLQEALGTLSWLLNWAFVIVTGMVLLYLYQTHSAAIRTMDIGHRVVLLACGAMLFLIALLAATRGMETLQFWGLSFACLFGMIWAWSQRNSW